MAAGTKTLAYRSARQQIAALTPEFGDAVAAMASVSSILYHALPDVSWVGFYRVVQPDLLRVGPYQGPVGCLEIAFGRGVCGTAAATATAQVVPDVHAFPGHIACDALSLSEIVVPVYDDRGRLVAVLDLDSHRQSAFDSVDLENLERIVEILAPCF